MTRVELIIKEEEKWCTINVFVIIMSVGCITCLVEAVVLCTDCFPNPHEARLSVNYESGLFPRKSGQF